MDLQTARNWYSSLLRQKDKLRLAAIGAGVIGDPAAVDDLISLMQDAQVARSAGEAFSVITGADLLKESLTVDAPEGIAEEPIKNADSGLLWPSQNGIKEWWRKRKGEFRPGVRYFNGHEMTTESLRDVLRNGTQTRRTAAALNLAVLEPSRPIFDTGERGDRQLARLKTP
jgi:uncharacterized protein (TIGR02270 family)